jgi:hypothetical protein
MSKRTAVEAGLSDLPNTKLKKTEEEGDASFRNDLDELENDLEEDGDNMDEVEVSVEDAKDVTKAEKDGLMYGGGEKSEGQFTAFNLNEERRLGNYGQDGSFTWTRRNIEDDTHAEDAWLQGNEALSKEKLVAIEERKNQIDGKKMEFNKVSTLRIVEKHLLPGESVDTALRRLAKSSGHNVNKKPKKKSWRDRKKKAGASSNAGKTKSAASGNKGGPFLDLTGAVTQLLVDGEMASIYSMTKDDIGRAIILS